MRINSVLVVFQGTVCSSSIHCFKQYLKELTDLKQFPVIEVRECTTATIFSLVSIPNSKSWNIFHCAIHLRNIFRLLHTPYTVLCTLMDLLVWLSTQNYLINIKKGKALPKNITLQFGFCSDFLGSVTWIFKLKRYGAPCIWFMLVLFQSSATSFFCSLFLLWLVMF